jgi:hypothetical protein
MPSKIKHTSIFVSFSYYLYTCVCVYIYIYIYTHTHTSYILFFDRVHICMCILIFACKCVGLHTRFIVNHVLSERSEDDTYTRVLIYNEARIVRPFIVEAILGLATVMSLTHGFWLYIFQTWQARLPHGYHAQSYIIH